MRYLDRSLSPTDVRRIMLGVGGLYIVLALGKAGGQLAAGGSFLNALSGLVLVAVPGLLIFSLGYGLPERNIHPQATSRIIAWGAGGFGLLLSVVGLRVLSPGVTIDGPFWSAILATSIGSVAGLTIGVYQAEALSRAQIAEQRSQELEQTKTELETTVEQLQKSNERLEQFAYAASHDLQEPMRMVSSYLQLLEDRYRDDLDEEAEEYIDFAVDGADRMRAMVDSLLDYSRVTHGNPLEPTDADAVVDRVLADLHLRIEETDATVTRDDLPTVTADPDQLAQVLRNLISNALEYSGDDPPEIHIGADRVDETWEFEVSDEGIGIDPEYQDRIFNVFEQVHTEEAASGEGGGIGLALCERILERHGGDIWVESAPGEGTTFYFTIPTEPPEDAQPVSTPNTATAEP